MTARLALAAALALAACGPAEPGPGQTTPAPDAAPAQTAAAEPEPEPEPEPPVCAVRVTPGEARVFGVCTTAEIEAALAAPAAADPRRPSCVVRFADGAAYYERCEDLSAAGLDLLEDAAENYSPPPAAPPPASEQP